MKPQNKTKKQAPLVKPKKKIEKKSASKQNPKTTKKNNKPQTSQPVKNDKSLVAKKNVQKSEQTTSTPTPTPTPIPESSEIKKTRKFQKILVFGSRGMTEIYRHTMLDMRTLLPHSKRDMKFDAKDDIKMINEICSEKNCENCMFFEVRKKKDCYMYLAKYPNGPTAKFLLQNVHTMKELKMTGNCLKGSRPLLSFDANFDSHPHWKLLKQVFIDAFGTPKAHPKSKPFVDHVFYFGITDNRIWFRNYQIVEAPGDKKHTGTQLIEIGPRLVMNPIKILSGSFQGSVIYENPDFVPPNKLRASLKLETADKYQNRVEQKKKAIKQNKKLKLEPNPIDTIFINPEDEMAGQEEIIDEE